MPLLIIGQGIARAGHGVFKNGVSVGTVTSGTMIPYWVFSDKGILSEPTDEKKLRPVALAYIDSDLEDGERVEVQHRGKTFDAIIMERNLTGEAPPYARPLLVEEVKPTQKPRRALNDLASELVEQAAGNTLWRQRETFNLIPSETTPSLAVRLLTIMDPSGRYAEHKEAAHTKCGI